MMGRPMENKRISVLVADGSPSSRSSFRGALEPKGYGVVGARSGREAIDVIRSEPVDVVVMDLWLPDYTGIEIYHAIKAIRRAFLPCIFTALEPNTRSFQDALSEEVITILPKPVDVPRLVHAVDWSVRRYCAGRRRGGLGSGGVVPQ